MPRTLSHGIKKAALRVKAIVAKVLNVAQWK